jgi:phosphatidylserine/phosphatidylglycerophosphate/cardiolipin synthase-like enzyme
MYRPLNAVRKQRNCHVKYISFDGQVAITGSGNMDTQRWVENEQVVI